MLPLPSTKYGSHCPEGVKTSLFLPKFRAASPVAARAMQIMAAHAAASHRTVNSLRSTPPSFPDLGPYAFKDPMTGHLG